MGGDIYAYQAGVPDHLIKLHGNFSALRRLPILSMPALVSAHTRSAWLQVFCWEHCRLWLLNALFFSGDVQMLVLFLFLHNLMVLFHNFIFFYLTFYNFITFGSISCNTFEDQELHCFVTQTCQTRRSLISEINEEVIQVFECKTNR